MKPTTEDFLIPLADVLRIYHGMSRIEDVKVAAKARIHAAIAAKKAHDEECQRMADEWVKENKAAYFQKASDSRFAYGYQSNLEYRHNLDAIWNSMRDEADPIFRDYVTTFRPTE